MVTVKQRDKKITVLAERGEEILLRIYSSFEGFKTVRHEWWFNKDMMKKGIRSKGNEIYCRGFAGSSDADVLELFNAPKGEV